jgi:hypothetical protein
MPASSSILCIERSPERGEHMRVIVDMDFPLQPLFEHSSQALILGATAREDNIILEPNAFYQSHDPAHDRLVERVGDDFSFFAFCD